MEKSPHLSDKNCVITGGLWLKKKQQKKQMYW